MDHATYSTALKGFVQKLKEIKIRQLALKVSEWKKAPRKKKKRASWEGISHGHHVVENGGSMVIQRGQVGLSEAWLFAIFDQQMGDGSVVSFLQSHLFETQPQSHPFELQLTERQIARKAKVMIKKAYNATQPHEMGGSATALVVNGEKIVAAHSGGYKAVLYQRGTAIQIGSSRWKTDTKQWSLNGISEKLFGRSSAVDEAENKKISPVVDAQKLGSHTEFMILASYGVWEVLSEGELFQVLGDQEAVSLIRHIEDAQEAAKCLADEALARMTKSAIVCIIIRFK